jgi:hypothetical protein
MEMLEKSASMKWREQIREYLEGAKSSRRIRRVQSPSNSALCSGNRKNLVDDDDDVEGSA